LRKVIVVAFALFGFASQASAGPEYVRCPDHGQDAHRVNVERIAVPECPRGAERDTYEHTYVEGSFLKQHTFSITECL
jgi:hypothetical protein